MSLFGSRAYDANLERPDDVPFEEQLRGLDAVIKAGKVGNVSGLLPDQNLTDRKVLFTRCPATSSRADHMPPFGWQTDDCLESSACQTHPACRAAPAMPCACIALRAGKSLWSAAHESSRYSGLPACATHNIWTAPCCTVSGEV